MLTSCAEDGRMLSASRAVAMLCEEEEGGDASEMGDQNTREKPTWEICTVFQMMMMTTKLPHPGLPKQWNRRQSADAA